MSRSGEGKKYRVKKTHFPASTFCAVFCVLLLMAGMHAGIVELMHVISAGGFLTTGVVISYWIAVSALFTLVTGNEMKRTYEAPMQRLAEAAEAVAHGDFSVYVPPLHTMDKLDYLDVMIMNFNTMVEELGSMETLKTDFFSNVSHEIKTPLAVISNCAQMLEKEELPEEKRKEYVETLIRTSRKLSRLITNILKLNKLEKQAICPAAETYDLCRQICDCALAFENIWEEKELEFEAEMEDRAFVEADKSLMELVWNNLFSNAVKFTRPGGRIVLKQRTVEGRVVVSVGDTGCGMTEETVKHIFDKFYQGDTSHATEGNGLGLALVLRVLELLNGTITVESELHRGTTFTVTLPVNHAGERKEE